MPGLSRSQNGVAALACASAFMLTFRSKTVRIGIAVSPHGLPDQVRQ
jgi:hypothetical protein